MKAFALTILAVFLICPQSKAGFDSGNAGDAFSAEFLFTGRDILQRLELLALNGQKLVDTVKLRAAMEKTKVVSKEHVYLDNQERDAVNYPSQNLIEIGRERWKFLRQASETKARLTLVLHEFLYMIGTDDQNFIVTKDIVEKLNIPPYSPAIWLKVPGKAFAVAECTGRLKDGSFITVTVNTKGVTRAPDHGEVQIERAGNKFGYRFSASEVSQFFESDDETTGSAMIGVGAYVGGQNPLSVKYVGPNFVDQDLKAVIEIGANTPAAVTSAKNYMLVWRGPGHAATDDYKVENPVCAISSNN